MKTFLNRRFQNGTSSELHSLVLTPFFGVSTLCNFAINEFNLTYEVQGNGNVGLKIPCFQNSHFERVFLSTSSTLARASSNRSGGQK